MPRAPQQTSLVTAEDHAAEVEQQESIAANVASDEQSPLNETEVAVAEEAPAVQYVKLVPASDVDISYPLRVSLVGAEDEIVFEDADASAEVAPTVAEQVRFLTNVEVAA